MHAGTLGRRPVSRSTPTRCSACWPGGRATFPEANVVAAGHRVVHGGIRYDQPVAGHRRGAARTAGAGAAGAAAPAAQHRRHRGGARGLAACAAGRLLRHRLPPRPSVRQRRVRAAAPLLRRGRAALRLPRPVLRIRHRPAARDRAAVMPPGASWSRIWATAPRCAPSATASRWPARWGSPRSTACRWARAAASSIPAWCCI